MTYLEREVLFVLTQLRDFVKLVAWKSVQGRGEVEGRKVIAASCCRENFERLLKSFISGATLRHDDCLCVSLFTSK